MPQAAEEKGVKAGLLINGARAAAGLVVDSVNAAGDLGESINKVNVVFDTSAGVIQKWSEGAATALLKIGTGGTVQTFAGTYI